MSRQVLPVGREVSLRSQIDRRASVRRLSSRAVLSRPQGAAHATAYLAAVRNISEGGIGLLLQYKFPPGTILAIEPLSRRSSRTLLARVVHATAEADGWYHGCELANQLSETELDSWL